MLGFSAIPLATLDHYVTPLDQGDGMVTLVRPDGFVLSCQPNGQIETRSEGSSGVYEKCAISGSLVTYTPGGTGSKGFVFVLTTAPNV